MTSDEAALDRLPPVYACALRLRAAGMDQAGLAAQLGVEPEAIPALLDIAEAKLASALESASPDTAQTGG